MPKHGHVKNTSGDTNATYREKGVYIIFTMSFKLFHILTSQGNHLSKLYII